ncbi:hypothetical protein AJ80_06121 [Polytolypa hystricis UAMH7299]|uniref:Uncharacterized protein n=1 Tax=Polytolypa hystricis (strain UAMH7299) TaxID=1447883 RepID=A0A2B7XYX5_POLH7|nr:hypothetical protein AJ80_06121 [Polytolypa hystricis UAMH7299]
MTLAAVFHELIAKAKQHGSKKLLVHRAGYGPLEIRELSGEVEDVLPSDLKETWAGAESNDGDESDYRSDDQEDEEDKDEEEDDEDEANE